MPGKKLPQSTLPPRSPNYANARGRAAAGDNEGIQKEANPGVSPASALEPVERADGVISAERDDAKEFQDKNYAQYMNRGDGRYLEHNRDKGEGSFGKDKNHRGRTQRIHRLKPK